MFVDRELVLPKAVDPYFPWWLNHLMHTMIMITILVETILAPRTYPKRSNGLLGIIIFLFIYLVWYVENIEIIEIYYFNIFLYFFIFINYLICISIIMYLLCNGYYVIMNYSNFQDIYNLLQKWCLGISSIGSAIIAITSCVFQYIDHVQYRLVFYRRKNGQLVLG